MKYVHIGWCNTDNHDKVWGIIQIGNDYDTRGWNRDENCYHANKYVTFWGRRGKKLQTKIWDGWLSDASREFRKKLDKGYKEVNKEQLDKVYPEFEQDLDKTAFWATLAS